MIRTEFLQSGQIPAKRPRLQLLGLLVLLVYLRLQVLLQRLLLLDLLSEAGKLPRGLVYLEAS